MTKITMTANKGQTHVQRAVSGATRLFFVLVLCLIIAPSAWSGYQEGKDAYNRKDYATARKELQPVAEQGDAEAQYLIGYMYYKGQGVKTDGAETVQRPQNGLARPQSKAISKHKCALA